MCGIFGILFKDDNRIVKEDLIRSAIATMIHRGPDAEGVFVERNIGLGHRRLSIIGLSSGHQPIFNEDGNICVVFNGEIYNFMELKERLEGAGHRFYTKTDTEVIVHSYEEWGEKCIEKFRGMFAFAIYDSKRKSIFIARDRIGIKPLYFYDDKEVFVFASEIKAILNTGLVNPEVNLGAIDFYITLGYVPAPETLFRNIYKLEPGHYIVADENGMKKDEYWSLRINIYENHLPPFEESCERLNELLFECVKSHLVSDVPLGVFLSGGLDSSSIVAFMSKIFDKPIKTFSVGYEDARDVSELDFARKVAKDFKTEHYEFILKPGDFFESIETFLYYSEEPVVESAAIALYHLSKLARSNVTVLLSGEGADELFGGYPLYRKMYGIERIYRSLRFVPSIRKLGFYKLLPEKYSKYLYWVSTPFEERYKTVSSDIVPAIKDDMYSEDFREIIDGMVENFFQNVFSGLSGMSILQKMLYVDTKYWLPDDLLLKADKMTMATSVELRVPFLDHKLVEFAFSLPDYFKVNRDEGKLILKKAVGGILPREIIYRQKKGFPVPISRWFSSDLHNVASEILLDSRTLSRGYYNRNYIERMLYKHKAKKEDMSRRIFSFVVLEMWHRRYID